MEQFKLYDQIICIDLKCFFATAECIDRKIDPFTTDLIVADTSRGKSSIILAVSPSLRAKGVPGRCRIFELSKYLSHREIQKIIFAKPRMARYVEMSNNILKMYLESFSESDILVYSIDEVFIDVSSYLSLYKKTTYEIAKSLLEKLVKRFGMYATVGYGDNLLLAKFALDIEAKHNEDFIAHWTYDDLPNKLWPITNLTSVWGIGRGMEKRLHDLGIYSMYDLAHFDIYRLVKELGIMGEELYLHAHGIDVSKIRDQEKITTRKGYSIGQTLYQNTPKKLVRQKVKDLVLQQTQRLRSDNMATNVVQLYVGYSTMDTQPSFRMQKKLASPTLELKVLDQVIMDIFDHHVLDIEIRKIGVSFSGLTEFHGIQLNLFEQGNDVDDVDLDFAYDSINVKYGTNTVFKASALTEDSSLFERSKLVGGHNAK